LANDFGSCDEIIRTALCSLPKSAFHEILQLDFSNDVQQIAKHFTEFYRQTKTSSSRAFCAALEKGKS